MVINTQVDKPINSPAVEPRVARHSTTHQVYIQQVSSTALDKLHRICTNSIYHLLYNLSTTNRTNGVWAMQSEMSSVTNKQRLSVYSIVDNTWPYPLSPHAVNNNWKIISHVYHTRQRWTSSVKFFSQSLRLSSTEKYPHFGDIWISLKQCRVGWGKLLHQKQANAKPAACQHLHLMKGKEGQETEGERRGQGKRKK